MRAACWAVRVAVALSVGTIVACGQGAPERAAGDPTGASSEPPSQAPASTTPTPHPRSAGQQRELDNSLLEAAWANDLPRARELIAAGADVDFEDETQQSAYLIATSEGHRELLELALAAGADLGARDSFDGTGLIRAAERGHADIVGRLLRSGIAVDHVNRPGFTALHEAIIYGDGSRRYVDTVRLLVARGADVSLAPERDGILPIQHARSRGQDAVAATLQAAIDAGHPGDPDQLLLDAAAAGDADQVVVALRAGAALEVRDGKGRTPLLLAATHDRVDVARLLVALGADPDALDHRHDTPWLVTGVTGSVPMLEVLLPAGPDQTVRNRFGGVSVIPAAERGHVEYVRRVVQTGIDVNHVNDPGWTALLEAVVYGDGSWRYQEVVRILLAAGADPAIADAQGRTALEHATARQQQEVALILRGG
ncbi:ankyrin repeat domain-containing protein [Blastococcus sp. CT_GayMR19]|uniref:ankyrin repeat domain-containing protein n=1 Tax=Blastococcus sp. CT_GayMR19 TaxID=2559608 RepID=UPI0010740042|nr:ankyrin repeat domain-containing protein [Blastococcus sp. CT_GayMR19]TFV77532.1 ankyrin repeat domain-containing protein [Blastococcus sp. CT_GayMR19]